MRDRTQAVPGRDRCPSYRDPRVVPPGYAAVSPGALPCHLPRM